MNRRLAPWVALCLAGICLAHKAVAAAELETIRQETEVSFNGKREVWQLKWLGEVKLGACTVSDAASAITCPCQGFAEAESGHLVLDRIVDGNFVERLDVSERLKQLPGDFGGILLPRWPVAGGEMLECLEQERDGKHESACEQLKQRVQKRAPVNVMQMADYAHDGAATQFLLHVMNLPCGKPVSVAIGVTRARPRLDVLRGAENPTEPLALFNWEWEAMVKVSNLVTVVTWNCGDHGSEVETRDRIEVKGGDISVRREESKCDVHHRRPAWEGKSKDSDSALKNDDLKK